MMWIIGLLLLLWAIHKWIYYRLTVMAILLYLAECGYKIPDMDVIQKYRMEVARKSIKVKEH